MSTACEPVSENAPVTGALHEELPWLAGRRVAAANEAAADRVRGDLERLDYRCRELEGERIVSDESFFDAIRRAFELDGEAARDWDEVVEGVVAGAGAVAPKEALLWHRADASAHFSLRTVVEAVNALIEARGRLLPSVRLEVVLLGATRDFPHPPP